ncbi:MAG: diacylglycerol kinase family protein [Kiritimatiellae bacterium]|nr:diacylglycerol kinase family protein [Kiritimatiellia bacterium]
MNTTKPLRFTGRIRSFKYAFCGIWAMIRSQHNAWIHAAATVVVVAAGLAWGIEKQEWLWIILAIVSVWTAEALNTAFEFLADATSPAYHPLVGKAKDVAAAAVLIAAMGSVAIGVLVLGPYLINMIRT